MQVAYFLEMSKLIPLKKLNDRHIANRPVRRNPNVMLKGKVSPVLKYMT